MTFERECLAVVSALEHFRDYLLGRPFELRTDHKALQWLFSKEPKASARVSGWFAKLTEYPVVIDNLRVSDNTIADILSHLSDKPIEDTLPSELSCGFPTYVCHISVIDSLESRTD